MIGAQSEGMQTIEMDLARLVASGMLDYDTAASVSQYPKDILAQAATARSRLQAQATIESGQGATTGSGQYVSAS
jgi:twitching motility protein PilT